MVNWGHKASECWTPDPRKTQVHAVGDQAAKGEGSNGSPAATPSSTATRPGEIRAVRTAERYYICSECGSDEGYEIGKETMKDFVERDIG